MPQSNGLYLHIAPVIALEVMSAALLENYWRYSALLVALIFNFFYKKKFFLVLLKASNSSPMFNRISAMDPAGPLFYNDIPYPYNKLDITSDSRLSKHDAHLVDAIHTDGQPRFYGHIIQYGTLESVGK